jgi:Xaa-Pro aminopeptidase
VAKSVKNEVEIEGFRKAYIQDGIVQTRFFKWLEEEVTAGHRITESDASDKLHQLRAAMPDFLDESFETISAYGRNAALPHYTTVRGRDAVIEPHGLYLNDSGAHYKYGTTDITRTVPMGPLTYLEREDYTLDMMAMIDLAMAIFPEGTPGCRIDAIARRPLWQTMRNFGHGTGHGVGNVLSVHEGPQSIRQNLKSQPLLPGMITSDEPGIYREGFHGVRHENMILCVPAGENEFGRWLSFETLTLTYLDVTPLVIPLMERRELEWLNQFNNNVFNTLKPYLDDSETEWLDSKTKAINIG